MVSDNHSLLLFGEAPLRVKENYYGFYFEFSVFFPIFAKK